MSEWNKYKVGDIVKFVSYPGKDHLCLGGTIYKGEIINLHWTEYYLIRDKTGVWFQVSEEEILGVVLPKMPKVKKTSWLPVETIPHDRKILIKYKGYEFWHQHEIDSGITVVQYIAEDDVGFTLDGTNLDDTYYMFNYPLEDILGWMELPDFETGRIK